MVVYYEPYPAMFPTPASRHHQNFNLGHYSYGQSSPGTGNGHSQFSVPHPQEMSMPQFSPVDSGGLSGVVGQLQPTWHAPSPANASSMYSAPIPPSSSCSRTPVFDEWSPRSPCAHLSGSHQLQSTPGCASPVGYNPANPYKLLPDFSQPQPPAQDLSVHGGGQQSPDSGLTVSSDGVSSSDSPGTNNHVLSGVQHHPNHASPAQHGLRPPIIRSPFDWMKKPSYQTQLNPGKTRTKDKYRVVYSDIQRLELEKEFHYSRYITIRRKAELAQLLGLSERQVKIWFQNRRAKERKQVKKREELVQKEKDIIVHHHLQPLQMGTPNGLNNKMVALE